MTGDEDRDAITVIVADAGVRSRNRLRELLLAHAGLRIVRDIADGPAAVRAARDCAPDVLFVDAALPGLGGLGVARELRDTGLRIVILASDDAGALEAFDVQAFDYLRKPLNGARLDDVLERVRRTRSGATESELARALTALIEDGRPADALDGPPETRRRLLVASSRGKVVVDAASIEWFEADEARVLVHAPDLTFTLDEQLRELEPTLDPAMFSRVTRGALVNLTHVVELQPWAADGMLVVMRSGQRLAVSRAYRASFMAQLAGRPASGRAS